MITDDDRHTRTMTKRKSDKSTRESSRRTRCHHCHLRISFLTMQQRVMMSHHDHVDAIVNPAPQDLFRRNKISSNVCLCATTCRTSWHHHAHDANVIRYFISTIIFLISVSHPVRSSLRSPVISACRVTSGFLNRRHNTRRCH